MRSRTPGRARPTPLTPLRREGRVAPVEPVVNNSCAFYTAHEAAGAAGIRSSLRPLLKRDIDFRITRARDVPRECGVMPFPSLRGAKQRPVYARCASFAGQESAEALLREGGSNPESSARSWIASRSLSSGRAFARTRWLTMTVKGWFGCLKTEPETCAAARPAAASHVRVALGADGGDAHHVGGAGHAERHAGDDDHALAGADKTVAKRDAAGTADHVVLV